ncbi:MAG: hypothetical protein ACWGSQ_12055 [Longimicrobiales bacterium]
MSDYREVEPSLGTMEQLKDLATLNDPTSQEDPEEIGDSRWLHRASFD